MTRLFSISISLAALALALAACDGSVEGGAGTGGTGGRRSPGAGGTASSGVPGAGGAGGSGGSVTQPSCATYTGDGCTPGDTMMAEYCIPWGATSVAASSSGGGGFKQCCSFPETCELVSTDGGTGCETRWNGVGCETPLVLSFDGAPVELREDRAHGFALSAVKSAVTDWPTARTPWLALDRDGDGAIGDGSELFGSMTVLAGGRRAQGGFAALRELDDNGDGRITPEDSGFARLVLWSDADGDRRSTAGELAPLASRRILSIELDYAASPRCDARGNCEVERAPFTWLDASGAVHTGEVIDVHLALRP